jgi:hypothetical protein
MEKQEDVKQTPVEETTVTESSPVEAAETAVEDEQTTESTEVAKSDETPASESTEPEQVSKDVFLERLNKEIEKRKSLEEKIEALSQSNPKDEVPELDPDAAVAVKNLLKQELEAQLANQKVLEFRSKHGAKLEKDEMLSIAVEREMRKQSQEGLIIDPEKALEDAEKLLNERMKPAQEQAKAEGVKEGQDVAKLKQQLTAVGEPGKAPEVDESKLSAEEFAKLNNIPRA